MYFISKTGSLLKFENGKAYAIFDKAKQVLNTKDGCLVATESGVYDQNRKLIKSTNIGEIYRTPDQRMMVQSGSDVFGYKPFLQYAIFGQAKGKIVFFTESCCIYQGQTNYIKSTLVGDLDLFPSNRHVTCVDRITPISDTEINLNIHTLHFVEDTIIAEIFKIGIDCTRSYCREYPVEPDQLEHIYTNYRIATYFVMKSGMVYEFDHNGSGVSYTKFGNIRVSDNIIICYDYQLPVLYDMNDRLQIKK